MKTMSTNRIVLGLLVACLVSPTLGAESIPVAAQSDQPYTEQVAATAPVAQWRFETGIEPQVGDFAIKQEGELKTAVPGPRPSEFPLFDSTNQALHFPGDRSFLRVTDPGEGSPLDFDLGDSITMEAWVDPSPINGGSFYLVGKGRTNNPGVAANNQNYAFRLQGTSGGAALNFLFRSRGKSADWHRWTSTASVPVGDGWHHVAVTYTFGKKDSIRGYIDGEPVTGKWDMGGATDNAPVVDNDELWIGSGMGGADSSTYKGNLDEVAIYRAALTEEQIKARFRYVAPKAVVDLTRVPSDKVLVDVYEGIPDKKSWKFRPPKYVESYTLDGFTFLEIPKKYSDNAVEIDRSNPFLIRAYTHMELPKGEHRILIRARNGSRLYLDGEQIAETAFHSISGDAHGRVFDEYKGPTENIQPLHRGDSEQIVTVTGDGKSHLIQFETIIGGQGRRPEPGETGVYIAKEGQEFVLLSHGERPPLTRQTWDQFKLDQREFYTRLNAQRRREADKEKQYWDWRHDLAREVVAKQQPIAVPTVTSTSAVQNDIDRFIAAKLEEAGGQPAELSDDLAFLRRVTVDLIGTVPTRKQIREFEADTKPGKRSRAVDRLLAMPQWADNWVGYWQDVLAENPNIVNPTLNNTGPFRWWIHESFYDNKPFDRFVTELVMMEGSEYFGGPGGFAMATQNDAPMAAKAHVIGQAFLSLQMKCARCHDAPAHDFLQKDLFSLAAMLKRGPQQVPLTSTIPGGDEAVKSLAVAVTLKPGEMVPPEWPFAELIADNQLPAEVLRNKEDERERLAALLTSPYNRRFAQTIVNRLWKRYLGYGLVEPVEDWEYATPSHPELLDYLANELITHDYDLKHVTRLILNSHTYQRKPVGREVLAEQDPYLFASPIVRQMTAEQLVDSLFVVAGKPFDAGPMNIDIDTARSYKSSLNLGEPIRAWQFTSLSNERDRPSLALPFAQPFVTFLETFGWRGSRQNPVNERELEPTVLQPAEMANGVLSRRISRLSDDSAYTELALQQQPLEQLVEEIYLRTLTRRPTEAEAALFTQLLSEGYTDRKVDAPIVTRPPLPRNAVAWSNHLDPKANVVKLQLEEAVDAGDPPTQRIKADWRERLEDMIWSLTNSPEFVFVP